MRKKIRAGKVLQGEVRLPGDKSISHRAIVFNSIADGSARISNFAQSEDCYSTIACLRTLGVEIDMAESGVVRVDGVGHNGLIEPNDVLNAGNSGTTMRLLTGLLSAQPFMSIITGDRSLRSRPMRRMIQPLEQMGAQIWGRCGDTQAPLVIRGGNLSGIHYEMPVASAQLKTALLLAGLYAQGNTVVIEPSRSRDHTERMLRAMGARISVKGLDITIEPAWLNSQNIVIPGDISSAAFWFVAGAVHPQARVKLLNVGVNPTRSGIIDVLRSMGANIKVRNESVVSGEPVADIEIESCSLHGVEIGGDMIPRLIDEIPIIALAGIFAEGKTVIRDAQELRVKESDRIRVTIKELSKMGAVIEEMPDGMIIYGGRKLSGAECHSHGDHRLAMMLGIAGLVADGETIVDNAEAADVSYPGFWQDLTMLSGG